MRRACRLGIVFLTAFASFAAFPVAACGEGGGSWYLNFEAGLNLLDQGDHPGIDADPGLRTGVAWGRNFNDWFSMELELAWLLNSGEPEGGGPTDWLGQTPLLLNFVFRHEAESGWIPYAGAGLGVVMFHDDPEPGGDAAFQWIFGVRRSLNETTSLGVSYKIVALFVTSLFADEWVGDDSITACLNWRY